MGEIFDTDKSFDFNKLILTKPTLISGGNYFIRFLVNNNHLYIQPPKCTTKQGFVKIGKRYYIDLMFTNENEEFINWMENLESHCHQYIYKNRTNWFDNEMELHDIENYFTSPLKLYKSGKFYITRVNITNTLGKPNIKIYDENEKDINLETINDKTNVITILEIQGIRCSASSFQIDIELKQMMVFKPDNLFEKVLIKSKPNNKNTTINTDTQDTYIQDINIQNNIINGYDNEVRNNENILNNNEIENDKIDISNDLGNSFETSQLENSDECIQEEKNEIIEEQSHITDIKNEKYEQVENDIYIDTSNTDDKIVNENKKSNIIDGMEEVEFNLEELTDNDMIKIKQRNDVYYEMYREAKRKAKIARDLALSSYLEAKRIKNTYMLEDIDDSGDSDNEMEFDNEDLDNE
jgi:hypothetical protein